MRLNREINARKKTDLGWLQELPSSITNRALESLGFAFSQFFRRVKAGQKPGYPRFKKKGHGRLTFAVCAHTVRFGGKRIRCPRLGWVRMAQELRFPGRVVATRFVEQGGHWYVAVRVEVDESKWAYKHRCETQAAVGVDLGLVDLIVLSNGEKTSAPRSLRAAEVRLRRLNKQLHRRKPGSKNREKTRCKVARVYKRTSDIRKAVAHTATASLVRRFRWIAIEDLNVAGMQRRRFLGKSTMDAALGDLRNQIEYKARLAGAQVVVADPWFPSSKTCSGCGWVNSALLLADRRWACPQCGSSHDRDVNAAANLMKLAAAQAVTACCQESATPPIYGLEQLSRGQESGSQTA